jgi:predicted dehydrogenase
VSLSAAVVGAGGIARQHLGCLQRLPDVEVVGICDLSPGAAEAAAERYGVQAWFTDRNELLAATRPDVVHVTTPPSSHFEIAADALAAGASAIVEKPLAGSLSECRELIATARDAGLLLVEDYNYLFQAEVRQIVAMRDRGELGEVTHVDVDLALHSLGPRAPAAGEDPIGPVVRDLLPHVASLAHLFAGEHRAVEAVLRHTGDGAPAEIVALVDGRAATASIRFSARSQPDGFWLRVHGTRMRAEANLFEPRITTERLHSGPRPLNPVLNQLSEARSATRAAVAGVLRKLDGGPGVYEGLWELLERVYGALAAGTQPPVTLEQIEAVNRLSSEIYERAAGHAAE